MICRRTQVNSIINFTYHFANKIKSISKDNQAINYSYDGTLLKTVNYSGTLNQTVNFEYNNNFQVISSTYAGVTNNYSYDRDGLLIQSGNYQISRDTNSAYTTKVTNGSYTKEISYNNYGEVTEVKDNIFSYKITQRDKNGAITQKEESLNNKTITYNYTYDSLGRLIEVKKNNQIVESYSYDKNGNRKSATINNTTSQASYTLDDQLEVYGNNSYRYDDDGYLIEKTTPQGVTTYNYNTLGALTDITLPDNTTIHYITDPQNKRVAKEVNGTITQKYLWADLTTLLAIYDKDDNLIYRFEYADQRVPISMTDANNNRYYLHYDQVGSLRAVSDSSGNIVKEITYDSYGNIISDTNPNFKVPFGFGGGLYDPDTKLTHFGFREYDAYTGKWTAKDPIGFDGGDSNLYGYVLNDPVNLVDPEGLWSPSSFPDPNKVIPNGPWEPNLNGRPGSYLGPKIKGVGRPLLQYVPDELHGGPKGAKKPYWKIKMPNTKGWQRFSCEGKPITPEQAHPGNKPPKMPSFYRSRKINIWCLIFCPTPAY